MSINVACRCGKKYRVRNEMAGKRAECSAYGQVLLVSQPKISSIALMLDEQESEELTPAQPAAQSLPPPFPPFVE